MKQEQTIPNSFFTRLFWNLDTINDTVIEVSQDGKTAFSIDVLKPKSRKAPENVETTDSLGDSIPEDLKGTKVFDISVRDNGKEINHQTYVSQVFYNWFHLIISLL